MGSINTNQLLLQHREAGLEAYESERAIRRAEMRTAAAAAAADRENAAYALYMAREQTRHLQLQLNMQAQARGFSIKYNNYIIMSI
jgi:hypothetical protein